MLLGLLQNMLELHGELKKTEQLVATSASKWRKVKQLLSNFSASKWQKVKQLEPQEKKVGCL